MATLSAVPLRKRGQGFTLIELLLAVFLLSILLGALVFNFTTLQPNPELLDGADRFESLLRYARAQAAYTGCRVQIEFEPEEFDWFGPMPHRIRLAWEPDPWNQPGVFHDLVQTAWDLNEINARIAVEQVMLPGSTPASSTTDPFAEDSWDFEAFLFDDIMPSPSPIVFLPDGSCESAEILLAARSEEDPRKVRIYLTGLTGIIRREVISSNALEQLIETPQSEMPTDLTADSTPGQAVLENSIPAQASTPDGTY